MPMHGPPGNPHGGQGNPMAYQQAPAPQNPGQGQVPPEILELIRRVLTTMPDKPTGSITNNTPGRQIPGFARQPMEQEGLLNMFMGLLQQGQPVSNAQSGLQGIAGGPFGGMGGRPRNS